MEKIKSGKVREIYQGEKYFFDDETLEIVTTDRVSAFDHVLNQTIFGKGKILNEMSHKWFDIMHDIVDNHVITSGFKQNKAYMIVKKAEPLPVECIVRSYLSGSAWLEYKNKKNVCGVTLPSGLKKSSKLPEPIFTPSTKSDEHDENISFEKAANIVGEEIANKIKDYSLKIYERAFDFAYKKGIIIADTKLEFGIFNNEIILIDELLTPDSSRFWDKEDYCSRCSIGENMPSYDKQIIRDYLLQIGWDKKPPIPDLPQHIIDKTRKKYQEVYDKLFG